MSVSKIFWFLTILTVALLGMQIKGYEVLNVIIALFIVDIVVLKFSHEKVGRKIAEEFTDDLKYKLGSVHSALSDLTNFMKEKHGQSETGEARSFPGKDITLGQIENSFAKHKDELREEFKNSLDKMAGKAIDIENKMDHMRKSFSAAVASLDDRISSAESPEKEEEPFEDLGEY